MVTNKILYICSNLFIQLFMHRKLLLYFIPVLLLGFIACQRDDDEPPAREIKSFSRLYVSTSDYQAGASTNFENVWVVDPADQESFPELSDIKGFVSGAKGGRTIHYTPTGGLVFQSSINTPGLNDTTIQVMAVNTLGTPANRAKVSNRNLDNVRGMYYTVVNNDTGTLPQEFLLTAQKSDTIANPYLYAFFRPQNSGFWSKPRYRMVLDFVPWGLIVNDKDVFIVKTGDQGGLVIYDNFTPNLITKADSLLTGITPSRELTINGSNNLRGISYSKTKDVLVLTDYSVNGNQVVDGRILIFDKFSSNTSTQNISPSRIIKGVNTGLVQPMDVAIDPREEGQYIYVADSGAKRVFRFLISDEGDVAPNSELNLNNRTPEGLSLDAR